MAIKIGPKNNGKGSSSSIECITPDQLRLLQAIVDLSRDDVTASVCLYSAALKAQMSIKEAQHIVYALLESEMLDEFTSEMKVSVTNKAVIYCWHRQDNWFIRFYKTNKESVIRGAFGTVGAIIGALLSTFIKLFWHLVR